MWTEVLVLLSVVFVNGLYEGDECFMDGQRGTCVNIWKCGSAINDIRNKKDPQLCSFEGRDTIVCCVDNQTTTEAVPQDHVTTTTQRPSTTSRASTNAYEYEYEYPDYSNLPCEPLPENWTTAKTGKKAWDKCLDYQDKLVYPCELEPLLIARIGRINKCHHNTNGSANGAAAVNEFPHMVMIGYGENPGVQWLCGGSIISENYVLTAAHCAAISNIGSATFVGKVLSSRETADESKVYPVKRVVRHPNYRPPSHYNDIALIELEIPFTLNQFTVPACVDTGYTTYDGSAISTGWGLNGEGSSNNTLQKELLNQISRENCSKEYPETRRMSRGFDSDTQACYAGVIDCKSENGSPLQIMSREMNCMYVVVGVTSFGGACSPAGEPGLYTRVQHYVPWIESVVWPDE